jgi:hypothetical protein
MQILSVTFHRAYSSHNFGLAASSSEARDSFFALNPQPVLGQMSQTRKCFDAMRVAELEDGSVAPMLLMSSYVGFEKSAGDEARLPFSKANQIVERRGGSRSRFSELPDLGSATVGL